MSIPVLSVLAPAAFAPACEALARCFERDQACKLRMCYGPATGEAPDALPNRLARGEPADVVLLPSMVLEEQIRRGHILAGSNVDVMRSNIGVCVRAGASRPDIGTVEALRTALLNATSVAYSAAGSGVYVSGPLLGRLGVAEQVLTKSVKVAGEPVGQVVARGEVELGFQQISELLAVSGIVIVGPLPAAVQHSTTVCAGVGARSGAPEAATALIRYLCSPAAAEVWELHGLDPAMAS